MCLLRDYSVVIQCLPCFSFAGYLFMGRTRSFMKMRKLRSQSTLHIPVLPILIANNVYFTAMQQKTNMLLRESVRYHAYKSRM